MAAGPVSSATETARPRRRRFLEDAPGETFWRSLHYFHLYRLLVALLFGLATVFMTTNPPFVATNTAWGEWIVRLYLVLAAFFFVLLPRWRPPFNLLLTIEVVVDVLVLTLLMSLSGGNRGGFSYMMLVVLAGAGLVGQGRLTLFYAALASVAVLTEQGFHLLKEGGDLSDFTATGVICMGFFGTAISAHLLSKRVVASETLARQRGEALAAQVRINAQVIREMQDGVLVLDSDGHVLQFNPRAAALAGVPGSQEEGRAVTLSAFFPELATHWQAWRRGEEDGSGVLVSPTGRPLHVRYLPTGDEGNSLLFIEDADQLQAQARQIKLAALGRLTANMAHEIRNPLAAISHAAELLKEEATEDIRQRLLRIIGENTGRLNRMVTDVLELGRRDKTHAEDIALAGFLQGFSDELVLTHAQQATVVTVTGDLGISIRFDRSHLSRILANLVGNALRYCSGKPGSVSVRVGILSHAKQWELWVEDDGPGIEPAVRNHVFEPFFTTRSNGTGLGLYIARELCEANGVTLTLMDSDVGTRFRMVGPLPG